MPTRKRFGHPIIGGMWSADDPRVLREDMAAELKNLDLSVIGSATPLKAPSVSSNDEGQGFAYLRVNGEYQLWEKANGYVYADKAYVSGMSNNTNRARFITDGEDVVVLDGDSVYLIKDGASYWRKIGAPYSSFGSFTTSSYPTLSITNAVMLCDAPLYGKSAGAPLFWLVRGSDPNASGEPDHVMWTYQGGGTAADRVYVLLDTDLFPEADAEGWIVSVIWTGDTYEPPPALYPDDMWVKSYRLAHWKDNAWYLIDIETGDYLLAPGAASVTHGGSYHPFLAVVGPLLPHVANLGYESLDDTGRPDGLAVRAINGWRYYGSVKIEFTDGESVESALAPIGHLNPMFGGAEPEEIKPSQNEVVRVHVSPLYIYSDLDPSILEFTNHDSGTLTVTVKIYRTKAGGTDPYLLKEVDVNDYGPGDTEDFLDNTADDDLGELYIAEDKENDRANIPAGTFSCFAQQRLFISGIADEPKKIYISKPWEPWNFSELDTQLVSHDITAMVAYGDRVVIFGADKITVYTPVDALGQLEASDSPVGTTFPDSVCVTDAGVLFARKDGLWLFDGRTSYCVSREIEPTWRLMTGEIMGCYSKKTMLFTDGANSVYGYASSGILSLISEGGSRIRWTRLEAGSMDYVSENPEDDTIWAQFNGETYEVCTDGDDLSMYVKTKEFGGGQVWRGWTAYIDANLNDDCTLTVTTSRGRTASIQVEADGDKVYRIMLPKQLAGDYFQFEFEGDIAEFRSLEVDLQ